MNSPNKNQVQAMRRGPIEEIWDKVRALWSVVMDPKAPITGKLVAIGALIYLVNPVDAIPDAIPVAGLADDVSVILAAVAALGTSVYSYLRETKYDDDL